MTITIDFDEVWFDATPKGMKLTEKEGVGSPFHFRLEIEATDREDWTIETVSIVDVQFLSSTRTNEVIVPLQGAFANEAKDFFYHSDKFGDQIQDKVNQEIIPDVSGPWPYETYAGGV